MNRLTTSFALILFSALTAACLPSGEAQAQIYEGTYIGQLVSPANGQTLANVYSYPGGGLRAYTVTGSSMVIVVTGSTTSGDSVTMSYTSYRYYAQPEDTSFWVRAYAGELVLSGTAGGGATGYMVDQWQYIADVPHAISNPNYFSISFVPGG